MGAVIDFRVCLFVPIPAKVEALTSVRSFQVRLGLCGLDYPRRVFSTFIKPSSLCPGEVPVLYKRKRFCSLNIQSIDIKKSAETPQASRLVEVTTQLVAETSNDFQNGASSPESETSQLAPYRSDAVRTRLLKKLSEANQFNRHLLRQVAVREKAIEQSKQQLSALKTELGVLVKIAQEIAKEGGKPGTRRINGRYIHSHLAVRLEECVCALLSQFENWAGDGNLLTESTTPLASGSPESHRTLLNQLEIVEGVRSREVEIVYYGMAENVVVMGSFDNWSHGEAMSPEVTGTFTKFAATVKLLPGRYELKFMVDGEWRLSNFLPIVGEGVTMNNILIVD